MKRLDDSNHLKTSQITTDDSDLTKQAFYIQYHQENCSIAKSNKVALSYYLQVGFLVLGLFFAFSSNKSDIFSNFSIIFISIILEAFPFMLLGALLGGLIEVFVSRDSLINLLPKNKKLSIIFAGLLGVIFPVCECAIVPVVKRLLNKGMPLGSAVTFLLGGPIVNPLVFTSTLVAYSFSWPIAILRVLSGFMVAVVVGLLIDRLFKDKTALINNSKEETCSCCSHHGDIKNQSLIKKLNSTLSHGAHDFYDICRFLIIGAFIAATLQTFVPRQSIVSIMTNPFISIFLMMILAIILSLCSEADAFISASLQPLGIPFFAQLSFMVLGPMLDIKLILMYLSVFTKRMIITLTFITFIIVFISMLFMEFSKWILIN